MMDYENCWVCVVDEETPSLLVRAASDIDAAVTAAILAYEGEIEIDMVYEAYVEVLPKICPPETKPVKFKVHLISHLSATPERLKDE